MNTALPSLDAPAGLASWLHQLAQARAGRADDTSDTLATLRQAAQPAWLASPLALPAALHIGGAALAEEVAALQTPHGEPDQPTTAAAQALCSLLDQAAASGEPAGEALGQALCASLGLPPPPPQWLDRLRTRFVIERGEANDLGAAIEAATSLHDWPLALAGLERLRALLGEAMPRSAYGLGATCLHRLGRYAEADDWATAGLGVDSTLLATPPIANEAELLARWGGRTEPVVSILCNTYNHERYLEQALRGFLAQDCDFPFEILIHDDASTDATQALIRLWQQRYPQIIKPTLQTENQLSRGVRPFELLLAQARGEFIATCEGDDYWIAANKLSGQVGYLRQHPDVACSAHNYLHYAELSLTVSQWGRGERNFSISPRQLMSVDKLLWLPTLVFRRHFNALPPERNLSGFGDQFLVSYLGSFGAGVYFDTFIGAVRRENEFSLWSPLPEAEKERRRVQTWVAIRRLHERLGHGEVVGDLDRRIAASRLPAATKAELLARAAAFVAPAPPASHAPQGQVH